MAKLSCGCTPDASDYGYCGECTRKLREKIWKNMDEKRKSYDRHFAPGQSKRLDDAISDYDGGTYDGCSCHINPPCSYCVGKDDEEEI
ncbi:hypothetical protein LCGC14_0351760 [marine sediment metagenome]|uniref:Uncharacterized protein n=1 Tax=marine sediment metagenome TaxID=412755 RepID=A0A0F9TTR0_9ZZZZ